MLKKIFILTFCFIVLLSNISHSNIIKQPSIKEILNDKPSLYKQNEFHPNPDDYFGSLSHQMPISSVLDNKNGEKSNKICITFDSAYINSKTYKILDILDKYDAKCTFFMTNKFIKDNPEQVKEISKRGHEIGNHSSTHPDFNKIDVERIYTEISTCHNSIKELLDIDMCLFRYPYGSFSKLNLPIVHSLGYYPIQWNFDTFDWKNDGYEALSNRIKKNEKKIVGGSIILFHNGADYTPDVLPELFEMLQRKGLKAIKVSDLIYEHNFYIESGVQKEKSR